MLVKCTLSGPGILIEKYYDNFSYAYKKAKYLLSISEGKVTKYELEILKLEKKNDDDLI